ncbi:hypothetical protein CK203_071528 [Vitis vinifera]|uniref:Uncharacterized protein n=1 Tax=Vitis vinifera TaxID=29760 RepID=A0A438F4B7_VITVI|nr:hypothetical protein CK203_071528 [Vitis vinifera]
MEALSRFPLSLPCLLPPHQSPSQTHFSNPIFSPKISSTTRKPPISSRETVAFAANPNDPKESVFMDENGAVDDMDGYLNHLSLEYDSVWDTKPSCSLLSSSTGREGFGSFLNTLVQYRELRSNPVRVQVTDQLGWDFSVVVIREKRMKMKTFRVLDSVHRVRGRGGEGMGGLSFIVLQMSIYFSINLLKSKMIPVGEVEGMDRFESSFRVGNPLPT